MRHRKSGRKLGRTWEHRKAMMKNMARSLVEHERIRTTEAKAKELRILADKLVTLALVDSLHARRQAYTVLGSHHSVKKLFEEIGPRFKEVPGGYTRVVKFGVPRVGDSAPMAMIEFTRLAEAAAEAKSEEA
jgi:large subunit ribosomal protein L17